MWHRYVNLVVAETAMGKLLSKASEGGWIDILGEWEDITYSELQQGSGAKVLRVIKVRPEAFPTGSRMSVG